MTDHEAELYRLTLMILALTARLGGEVMVSAEDIYAAAKRAPRARFEQDGELDYVITVPLTD